MNKPKLDKSRNEGKALLEFAFVLPFLIMITLFGVDLYKSYIVHQNLNFVSREMGNAIFRSCRGQDAGSNTTDCMNQQLSPILLHTSAASSPLQNVSADVRLYDYRNPAQPTLKGRAIHGSPSSSITPRFVTSLRSYNPLKGELVIVEVFLEQQTFSPFFSGSYYEATLF